MTQTDDGGATNLVSKARRLSSSDESTVQDVQAHPEWGPQSPSQQVQVRF